MGIDSTSRVLDVGAGLGATSVYLARSVGVTSRALRSERTASSRESSSRRIMESKAGSSWCMVAS